MLAFGDDLSGKTNGRIVVATRCNVAGDINKIVFGAVEEAKAGRLRGHLKTVGDGPPHVFGAVDSTTRN